MDTIYALATAQGKAGVAVVRISGADAFASAGRISGSLPPVGNARLRTLRDGSEILDHALVVAFKGPQSFTGDDTVEFQLHGGMAVVQAVLGALSRDAALRMAEPGEFTRRALENNRLDLSQVEALADLIDAETEAQRKQAQQNFQGALGVATERWRRDLIRAAALIEATIDFADEDVPVDVTPEVSGLLAAVRKDLEHHSGGAGIAERLRQGFEVAIVGPPNAGKSTLLNRLAGREAAITSEHAGTTRDVVEVRMDLKGIPVTFLDTAGLRESEDAVETIGIARAVQRAGQADIRVFLCNDLNELPVGFISGDVHLLPKADLRQDGHGAVSGLTGQGIDNLVELIHVSLSDKTAQAGLATRERHRVAMDRASQSISAALEQVSLGPTSYDIAAEDIRAAVRTLESLVGRIGVEDLLDEIFASFCLGK